MSKAINPIVNPSSDEQLKRYIKEWNEERVRQAEYNARLYSQIKKDNLKELKK